MPNTETEWKEIASDFEEKWNFPNCVGALDGKHVYVKAPAGSGSLYFNYKNSHITILMALAGANYKFTYVNIGSPGRNADGGVYFNSHLSDALENNLLNIPNAKLLPKRKTPVQFVVVADDAFALKPYMLKPFSSKNLDVSERIYNYRVSRARSYVECFRNCFRSI